LFSQVGISQLTNWYPPATARICNQAQERSTLKLNRSAGYLPAEPVSNRFKTTELSVFSDS